MASVSRGQVAWCRRDTTGGERQRSAAEALRDEGLVQIVNASCMPRGWYACIPPHAAWDSAKGEIRKS